MARFANSPWRTVLIIVLVVALLMGAVFGLRAIFSEEEEDAKKTISLSYSVGELSDAGKYVEAETAIYTKEAFECQGVRITPDFDNTVTYEVYFYDEDGYFISKSKEMDNIFTGEPLLAKYARIKITPVEDENVSWWEIAKYSGQLKVEVNVKQNDFKNVAVFSSVVDSSGWYNSSRMSLDKVSYLVVKTTVNDSNFYVTFFSSDVVYAATSFTTSGNSIVANPSSSYENTLNCSTFVVGSNYYVVISVPEIVLGGQVQVKSSGLGFTSVYLI